MACLVYHRRNQIISSILRNAFCGIQTYSTDISTLCSNGHLNQALLEMAEQGFKMLFKDYSALLSECISQKALREGQRVQIHMIKTRYLPSVFLRNRLSVFYLKCECLRDARSVFDEMPERDVVSWTAMICGYTQRGYASEALNLFVQMLRSGSKLNEFTFATVLKSCVGAFGLFHGKQIHSLIVKSPFESHVFVGCSLLDMYAKAGKIHEARDVFECLPKRDVVSCTAIVSGYAREGLNEKALELFRRLHMEGMNFNYVTYASILTALSGLAAFELGRQVHGHVLRLEIQSYIVLQNSLIDMYSKCGNLSYSRMLFDSMPDRTVASWNAMLMGYSKHGMGNKVIEAFKQMKEENIIRPDSITLLAVLSGCSHGGMEHYGLEIFNEILSQNDGVDLEIEHYGCVVDLLGRAGQVERALEFINQMPIEPNAAIWGSLLGACRFHQNVGVGHVAGNWLLEMEPENVRNYVDLSNLYASAGRWEEVRRLRELMKEKAMVKEPGKSWIEVERALHTFISGDRSHPRMKEIFEKVSELSAKIKASGYVPDTRSVLYDVDEEQKEKMLLGHSEKLALAFGLIVIPEGKMIQVIKNLRICVDCHSFAKFVSQVYRREVSLRDKARFHRISNGKCSCGDYW